MLKVVSLGVKRADNSIANSQTSSLCRFPASLICFSFCLACCSSTGDFTKRERHSSPSGLQQTRVMERASQFGWRRRRSDCRARQREHLVGTTACVFLDMRNCLFIWTFSPRRAINSFNIRESTTQIPRSLHHVMFHTFIFHYLFNPNLCTLTWASSVNMCKQAADWYLEIFRGRGRSIIHTYIHIMIHYLLKQVLLLFFHYYCMALVTFVVIAAMTCDTWERDASVHQ